VLSGIIAALMSTAGGTLIVVAATVTRDFYYRLSKSSRKHQLRVGQASVGLVGACALLFALRIPDIISLVGAALLSLALLLPAVVGGIFWSKASKIYAFWSICLSFPILIIGIILYPSHAKIVGLPAVLVSLLIFIIGSWCETRRSQIG